MNRVLVGGLVLALAGIVGYGLGVFVAYPGRAFSVTAVTVGVALFAIGRAGVTV